MKRIEELEAMTPANSDSDVQQRLNIVLVNTISPYYLVRFQAPIAVNTLGRYLDAKVEGAKVHKEDMQKEFTNVASEEEGTLEDNFDTTISNIANRIKSIAQRGRTIVGLSVKWATIDVARDIVSQVRNECNGNVLFVLGNIGATFGGKDLLSTADFINTVVVVGEGEEALTEIARKAQTANGEFANSATYARIPNVLVNVDGALIQGPLSRINLSKYPSDLNYTPEDIYVEDKDNHILETSRGCPWGNCTFCSVNSQFGDEKNRNSQWQGFPVDIVLGNMKKLVDQGVRRFQFVDSEFFGPVKPTRDYDPFNDTMNRARSIASGIIELNKTLPAGKKIEISHASVRVDTIYREGEDEKNIIREETFRMLKEAGLKGVYLGIESGSPKQLRRFGKGVTVKENQKAIEIMRKLGFEVEVGFIFFDYLADMQELQENLDFIEATRLYDTDSRVLGNLRVQEGSSYVNLARNKGLLGRKHDDFLGYECRYLNDDVGRVNVRFVQWEKATVKLRSVLPIERRKEIMKLDFMYVKELVADYINNKGENRHPILEKYRSLRREFLSRVRTNIDSFDLDPSNRKLLEEYLLRAETLNEGDEILEGQGMGMGSTRGERKPVKLVNTIS